MNHYLVYEQMTRLNMNAGSDRMTILSGDQMDDFFERFGGEGWVYDDTWTWKVIPFGKDGYSIKVRYRQCQNWSAKSIASANGKVVW